MGRRVGSSDNEGLCPSIDPARGDDVENGEWVRFYTAAFLVGCLTMSNEQVGAYMKLLCLQHQKGHLPEKEMVNVCGGSRDDAVFEKFELDKDGKYFNRRMDTEIARSRKSIEASRENGAKGGRKPKEFGGEEVIKLPLNDGSEYSVKQGLVDEMATLYAAVDVMKEFRGMRAWLVTNPTKRKTKAGILRFVNSWLSRAQDSGRSSQGNVPPSAPPSQKPSKFSKDV